MKVHANRISLVCNLALVAGLIIGATGSARAITGAIFTTDVTGATVNQNIYASCCDVYLNGGPGANAPCDSAGLPNGDYYFQVTNPSGKLLLSTDPVEPNRRVTVSGGVITAYKGVSGDCIHNTSATGQCFSLAVQLMPFTGTPNPGGEYKVWMTPVLEYKPGRGSFGFVEANCKTDNFKCTEGTPTINGTLTITKYYDANVNGQNDGEIALDGFQFTVSIICGGVTTTFTATTGADGTGEVMVPVPDGCTYNVCEQIPSSWLQTQPLSNGCYSGTAAAGVDVPLQFGDVCLGSGGGLTLGFWSNKNGQALLTTSDFTCLTALHLRNANGSDRDFTSSLSINKTDLRSWLLNATAVNMAYMLSAQLATMKLNVLHEFVDPTAIVYAPGCGNSGVGSNFITIADLITSADNQLRDNPMTTSASDPTNRAIQECLKNALDAANNNKNFVQSTPCEVKYP